MLLAIDIIRAYYIHNAVQGAQRGHATVPQTRSTIARRVVDSGAVDTNQTETREQVKRSTHGYPVKYCTMISIELYMIAPHKNERYSTKRTWESIRQHTLNIRQMTPKAATAAATADAYSTLSSMTVSMPISLDRKGALIRLGAVLQSLVCCRSPFMTVASITCRAALASMFADLPPYVRRVTFTTYSNVMTNQECIGPSLGWLNKGSLRL